MTGMRNEFGTTKVVAIEYWTEATVIQRVIQVVAYQPWKHSHVQSMSDHRQGMDCTHNHRRYPPMPIALY